MARARISGLRKIDDIRWSDVEDEPGVYLFYRRRHGPVRYVGRSDTSLYRRISGRPFTYYRYKHCDNDVEAYKWECTYYHRHYVEIGRHNQNHPAKPKGLKYAIKCDVCGD